MAYDITYCLIENFNCSLFSTTYKKTSKNLVKTGACPIAQDLTDFWFQLKECIMVFLRPCILKLITIRTSS